jgi:hypothetical protein
MGPPNRAHVQRLVAGVQDENLLHLAEQNTSGSSQTALKADVQPGSGLVMEGPVLGWRTWSVSSDREVHDGRDVGAGAGDVVV